MAATRRQDHDRPGAGALPPGGVDGSGLDGGAVDEDTAWKMYLGMSREVFTALERGLGAAAGASVADLELLEPLLAAGEPGLRAKDLAAAAEWQDSRVSHQLRRMERRGLVSRTRDRQDGRGTVVGLTAEGLGAARAARATRQTLVRELLIAALTPAQVSALVQISAQVRAHLTEHGDPDGGVR